MNTFDIPFVNEVKEFQMEKLQIEWGDLHRTEAIESAIFKSSDKVLSRAPTATHLIVTFKIVNPVSSAGAKAQRVSMELRLPQHQDVRSEKQGEDLYRAIIDVEKALLSQLEAKKDR